MSAAAAAAPTELTTAAPAPTQHTGVYNLSFIFFQEDEDFDFTNWEEDADPHGWDAWMNTAPCGNQHLEYEFCPFCRDIEATESLVEQQDREFEELKRNAYDASLTGPDGNDHSERKLQGDRAREAKESKHRKNADRHNAKLERREKRRVAREDPSSAPIGVKADRYPKARHQKRANDRRRNCPHNHKAQRQRDVHDERFAPVYGLFAEQADWYTPDDIADVWYTPDDIVDVWY